MTAFSWAKTVSADWSNTGDWSPAGSPNAATDDATIAVSGAYTVTIATAESFLVDSLTFDPATSGVLALNGTLTLGGTEAEMTVSSGIVKLAGTIAGGSLSLSGGVLDDTGAGVITSATYIYGGGTVAVASGKTLTLTGATTLDSGAQINGPGTLATTGSTSIIGTPQLDGALVWDNTGTVSAGAEIYTGYPSGAGKVTINNQAGGVFDLTADGEAFLVSSTLALTNAGVLSKTGGTGTSNIANAITNTGTITATSGTLELDGGGPLGGTVTETATGAVTLGTGLFALTGTVNGAGTLTINSGATLSIGTVSETIASAVVVEGEVTIASGKTLTLAGPVTWDGSDVVGPGTLATTGTTTISSTSYLDGGLTWTNSGTVLQSAASVDGTAAYSNFVVINQSAGIFDFTSDGFEVFGYNNSSNLTFTNAGLLEKTAGTGIVKFYATLNNTGTVTASSGTLELLNGGTLGGVIGATGTGEIGFGGGTFTLSGTAQTITGAVGLDGSALDIASGQTLTLTGSVTMDGSTIEGPGTLVTTGATDITYQTFLDGSLVWVNSGTVTVDNPGYAFYVSYPSGAGTVTVDNPAGGVFDFTGDSSPEFYSPYGIPAIFSNAGLLEATSSSGVTFDAILNSTGSVLAGSGDLDLTGGGTLGGSISIAAGAELTFGGGTFEVTGGLTNNGTLEFSGGSASFTAAHETITGPVLLDGGTLDIAAGQTLTLSGSVTMDGNSVIEGPGTLVTTGAADIMYQMFLDGGLVWVNSGTITVDTAGYALYVSYPSYAGTVTIDNLAGGAFDLTGGSQAFYSPSGIPAIFSNAGLLEATAGSGAGYFDAILNSTGSVLAGSGDLDLAGGGTLGGSISISAGAELTFGGDTFEVTGGLTNNGTLEFAGGSASFAAAHETIAGQILLDGGGLDIASGQTVTLTGSVTMDGSAIDGPGTLVTTGATDITYQTFLDGSLVWVNSGTVTVDTGGYAFYVSYPSYAGTVTIDNVAGGVFDLAGAYDTFYSPSAIPAIFNNAGLLEDTSSSAVTFDAILNTTGTVAVSSGVLDLQNGGTLGGVIGATGSGEIEFGGGTFTLGGATQTITGAVEFTATGIVDIASGQTLTLTGAVNVSGQTSGALVGPGMLATTGTTTIGVNGLDLDGGLTWNNSGTVLDGGQTDPAYPYGVGGVTINNLAGGVFDITTAEQVLIGSGSSPLAFNNAGLLESTAGTGTVTFDAPLNNTGTVTTTSGTFDLDGGGTLNGTIGGTGSGLVQLDNSGFVTTGTLAILDAGSNIDLRIANGATLTDSGVIDDSGNFHLGNNSGASSLVIAAGASFDFTSNDGNFVNGGGATVTNVGTLAKIGGTGTSTVGIGFTNTGTVDAASGTLKLTGGVSGSGRLQIEAGDTLELANGANAGSNTIDLNGLGATLKIDTNSTVGKPIIGLGGGSRIDLAAATSVAAVINGNTLTITPAGGSALNFVSTSSLANLHITTGSDGGTGTVVTLYNEAAASPHTPEPVAFGDVHVGAGVAQTLTITNTAPPGGYTERLDGTLTSNGTGFTATGSFTGLGGGISNSTSLAVTLNTMNAGTIVGVGTLTLASDGSGVDGFGKTALPTQTVNVTGAVFNYATASAAAPNPVNFGEQHVGAALSQALSLTNLGTVGGFTEKLDASIGSPTGSATASGGFTGLAAGVSNSSSLTVGLNSTHDGAQSGTAAIALTSDGAGVDTLGTTALAAQTITVEGTLYNYAAPILSGASLEVGSATTMLAPGGNSGGSLGGLIADANGDLLGTTRLDGYGTVFEIANTSTGFASAPTTLVNFTGRGGDGDQPEGGLLANAAGDLFGTTYGYGNAYDDNGTVFELANTSTGYASTPTTLATFNGTDGTGPLGSLIENAAGDLFGETQYGGAYEYTNGAVGAGTVFEIANTSTGYASTPITLVSFTGGLYPLSGDGYAPTAGLAMDAAGDLFGMTTGGGAGFGGTVFEIANTSTGYASTPTTLLTFNFENPLYGGYSPYGGVLVDAAGDVFGTTSADQLGNSGSITGGSVFELVNTGSGYTLSVLSTDFPQHLPLSGPVSTLTEDAQGDLFGTTNGGALFELVKTDGTYASTPTLLSSSIGSSEENSGAPLLNAAGDVFVATYGSGAFEVSPTYTVNFGEQHVGAALSQALSVTNGGTADGFTENLDASIGNATGSATANGSFTGLAAGITNSSSLVVDLNSGLAGVQSGTATVTLTSDGAGVDTLGTTALQAQTITVEGTLYNYATASAASPNPMNFGIVHVGTAVSETLSISNLATAGSFSENLDGSIGGATSGVTANGAFTDLGGSATNTTSLVVGLNTSTAGSISGMATITLVSDGAGIDTLGTTMLAAQTVVVTGTVNNYATAAIEAISGSGTLTQAGTAYTLALGTIDLGTSGPELNFGVVNAASGPADLLGGSFIVSGDGAGAFINTLTAFSNVAAGNVASGDEVSLASSTAGAFSETITLFANGSNSGYLGALPEEVITVTGSVVAVPRTMIWTGASDTNFANASNWDDTTSGLDPAIVAPTTTDTAEFNSGGTVITGSGTAEVLLFDGAGAWHLTSGASLTASGSVIVGSDLPTMLLIDQGSSLIDAGSAVIANTSTASGSSVTGAGSDWGITGTLEVGNAASGTLDISSGATVSALDVTIGNASGLVSVGAGSELLLGGGGGLTVNGTLANFGAVSGGGATEVAFGSGTDRLILGPGATFGGNVVGGGVHTTLELAAGVGAGTLNALGTTFTNFGTVIVDAGATWTVDAATSLLPTTTFIGDGASSTLVLSGPGTFSLSNVSNFGTIDLPAGNNTVTVTDKTLSGGAVTINDGASGNNTISAASDTSASKGKSLTYVAEAGTDSFTGGFENDTVDVASTSVGGDTLTGGSGTNTLVLTGAGTPNLSGVTKFPTIDLAATGITLAVTDAMLSGGSLTINDLASGNTISAAGDTSASTGKTLTYNAGSGTDSFTGGFENDKVNVSAAAVGSDTLTGGSGTNTLTLISAGSANLGGVSKFATINLAAGNSTVTVTDTTLSGGAVTLHDGASGNNSISAASDTSVSTGKTLTYDAGTGTDSFTGGFETDKINVSAAAVGGDTLTGGSGTNSLTLTTAGSANLGGVSKFATIFLAAGNSTVTVTDTTLSGGAVTLHDGASGNNTISAAGDTAVSTGKTLTYYAGTGTDRLTGGFENDVVYVTAASVGGDTLTGGRGSNTLELTSAGTFSLGGVGKFGAIFLGAGNNTVTVADKTLTGGSVTLHDGASGNNTVSAASDTSASKGKTLTYDVGTGTDSFTGGFENDIVYVKAASVGGDTLTGGSGTNTLELTTAGTFNLGGVSKFGSIVLGAGNNTVTVTDTTLSSGSVALHDGASGNNSVSATGDTAASTGKTLTYYVGTGTDKFTGGFENDTVRVTAAAVGGDTLIGGSGTNLLVLTSAGSANLGGVSGFATIFLDTGNTVTVTDTTLSAGSVKLTDRGSGTNSVSAAGDTVASAGKLLTFYAGTGADSLTGGFENDLVYVRAAAVGGDTLTGGSGTNTLELTTAGSVNLGGVSKFGGIFLAAGNSTVTVTDKTLSSGSVSLHDGASGSNTISAAGDTAASTGKTLTYFAGVGTDHFTGGFENDTVRVTAAAVGGDTLSGGSGTNTLTLTTAGSVNLGGVSKFATINLATGTNTVTVTNKTLSGGSVAVHGGASSTNSVSAAGDTSASTGKTLTYYAGTGTDTFTGGFENDTIVAVAATLNAGDAISGGSGTNTLMLSGGGTFNLAAPTTLTNIQTVDAAEGQAAGGGVPNGVQTVDLRAGLDQTVNVASGTPNPLDPNPETITINGAANNDTINLGTGIDTVVLGGTGETVNGGGGMAFIDSTTAFAGALVNGGSGTTTLTITTGGTATLNANDSHLIVDLTSATNLTLSQMSFITAVGSAHADTITAMAQGQTLTGGGGTDTLIGYSGFGDVFSDTSAHLNTTTIGNFGGTDLIDLTDMNSAAIQLLGYNTSTKTLSVSDGTHAANIKFTGSYTLNNFQVQGSDGHTGSLIKFV